MKVYDSIDAMLADGAIDIVVNLTIHHAHYEITKRCLEAGRHVHSEKPLAFATAEAQELCKTAKANGVRLGSSPCTWMGEAQSTAWNIFEKASSGTSSSAMRI